MHVISTNSPARVFSIYFYTYPVYRLIKVYVYCKSIRISYTYPLGAENIATYDDHSAVPLLC